MSHLVVSVNADRGNWHPAHHSIRHRPMITGVVAESTWVYSPAIAYEVIEHFEADQWHVFHLPLYSRISNVAKRCTPSRLRLGLARSTILSGRGTR